MKQIGKYSLEHLSRHIDKEDSKTLKYEVKIYSNANDCDDFDSLEALRYAVHFYERKCNKIIEEGLV